MSARTFGAKLAASHGLRVKANGFIRRLDPIMDGREFKRFTNRYVRDTSKSNYRSPVEIATSLKPGMDYDDLVLAKKAPLRVGDDQHYIDFGNQLWFFGSANSPIVTSGINPFLLSEDERLEFITSEWLRSTKHLKRIAHHLVASLDPRLCHRFVGAGYPADAVVLSAFADAMQVLNSRFYPGESLGMLCGIHHDRPHIHAHVLVHPLTDLGRRINMTLDGSCHVNGVKYRVPYQQVLKGAFNESVDSFCEAVFPKPRVEEKRQRMSKMAAFEDLILTRRCLSEPAFLSEDKLNPIPRQFRLAGIREGLLSDPKYLDIICSARREQVEAAETRLQAVGKPFLNHKFSNIHESLRHESDLVTTAGDDLFLNINGLKAPEIEIGPFHYPGIGRALSRSSWASKQGITSENRPVAQAAQRITAFKKKINACRNASNALIAAADGLEKASDTHYAWAAQNTGAVLTGVGGWLSKIEPYLDEWEAPTDGSQRMLPRAPLVNSMNTELVEICRGISERYRVATLNDLQPYSHAEEVKIAAKTSHKEPMAAEVKAEPPAVVPGPARKPAVEVDDQDEEVVSEFDSPPGRIPDDVDSDNPITRIASMRQGSFFSEPLQVRLGDLLDMSLKKLGDTPQQFEPDF